MNKILTVSLVSLMLSLTLASAYEFEYARPDISQFSYASFLMAKEYGIANPIVQLLYALITSNRFYENQLAYCEVDLKKELSRSCGGGGGSHSTTQQIIIQTPKVLGDANNDGKTNGLDKIVWEYDAVNGYNERSDFNEDENIDQADFTTWADNFDGSTYDGAEYTETVDNL